MDEKVLLRKLILKDIESIDKRIKGVEKLAKSGDKDAKSEFELLMKISDYLNKGNLIIDLELSDIERKNLKSFSLLTAKPMVFIANIYFDYNFAGDNYASYDVTNRSSSNTNDVWQLPDFGLFDLGMRHTFEMGSFEATLTGKINNVFNTEYVSDANDIDGTASTAQVYFGPGRTYSVGLRVNF